jgi:hypothetical protein
MTARHASEQAIKDLGTDRISFTPNVRGAIDRAGGNRKIVVQEDPWQIEAEGGRWKPPVRS